MAFKFIAFFACVAMANAGALYNPHAYSAAPVAVANTVVDSEYDHNPQYSYSYGVHDSVTGDVKGQVESRSGDVVTGQYSLVDPDGTKRTVDYSADDVNGFNAVVSKTPLVAPAVVAAAPAVVEAKTVVAAAPAYSAHAVAAPVAYNSYNYAAAPVAYSAPAVVAKTVAAPVAYNYAAAPVAYSSHVSAPGSVSYSSQVAAAPAVVARTVAAPVAYAAPYNAAYAAPYSAHYAAPYSAHYAAPYAAAPVAYSGYAGPVVKTIY